jgi:hypothetical protein
MKTLITYLLLLSLTGCSKFDHKISTRVKGTVKYADGSPASGVYVKLVQVYKPYEGTTTSTSLYNIILIEETNSEGRFDFKFKDDPRPEGFPKDYSDYFVCISREFIDSHIAGDGIGMLSDNTEVEFLRTNDSNVGEKKNKIKTGRKNKIDAIIKN